MEKTKKPLNRKVKKLYIVIGLLMILLMLLDIMKKIILIK